MKKFNSWIILVYLFLIFSPIGANQNSQFSKWEPLPLPPTPGSFALPEKLPSRRLLLSYEPEDSPTTKSILSLDPPLQDEEIFVSPDGTIYFLHGGEALWKFESGPPISKLYQAALDEGGDDKYISILDQGIAGRREGRFFVDNGESIIPIKGFGKTTLMKAVADYVSRTPHISNSEITLGEKITTAFILEANNGSLINEFNLRGLLPQLGGPSEEGNSALSESDTDKLTSTHRVLDPTRLLYVTRTDYQLKSYAPISRKVLWNLTVSDVQASYLHQGNLLQLPVTHLRDYTLSQLLFGIISLYHDGFKSLPTPETKHAMVVFGSEDQNSMLPAFTGSPDQNSSSPAITGTFMPSRSDFLNNIALCLLVILVAGLHYTGVITISWRKSTKQLNESYGNHTVAPKKKKARKLGNYRNDANANTKETKGFAMSVDAGADGRMVGKLFISNIEIAKGSDGTIVFEGKYDGRPVAVKRLVQAHHEVAYKEIQNLIASDRHPNIVRWFGVEYDTDFVYLALELCTCSLNDLIKICSVSSQKLVSTEVNIMYSVNGYSVQLDSLNGVSKDVELWKANGHPSTQLLKLMRDVVSGVAHLHELGIIHRDLKPQNILIIKERSLCAKVSDMGISKRLLGDNASLGHNATGYGSSGWQAPEQLLRGRQTRAVDLFSLGCILFYCITGGKHPYGDQIERDVNIVKNHIDLFMVEHIPEAVDLFSRLLDPNPESRPTALDVMHHPLFWSSEMRLSFLRDASDRVELEDRVNDSDILKELENVAPVALGGNWDQKMEAAFLNNIGRYRRYKFDSMRDLLRVVRNKLNHYRELPKAIQELLGPVPEGFDGYFARRFPRFLVEVYKVIEKYCREEECLWKYFGSSSG